MVPVCPPAGAQSQPPSRIQPSLPLPGSPGPTSREISVEHTSHTCPASTPCPRSKPSPGVSTLHWGEVCAVALLPAPCPLPPALSPLPCFPAPGAQPSASLLLGSLPRASVAFPAPPRTTSCPLHLSLNVPPGVAPDPASHHPLGILCRADNPPPCHLVLDSLASPVTRRKARGSTDFPGLWLPSHTHPTHSTSAKAIGEAAGCSLHMWAQMRQ